MYVVFQHLPISKRWRQTFCKTSIHISNLLKRWWTDGGILWYSCIGIASSSITPFTIKSSTSSRKPWMNCQRVKPPELGRRRHEDEKHANYVWSLSKGKTRDRLPGTMNPLWISHRSDPSMFLFLMCPILSCVKNPSLHLRDIRSKRRTELPGYEQMRRLLYHVTLDLKSVPVKC